MPVVTLVFLDGGTMTVMEAEALKMCSDPIQARDVLDALTDDTKLQDRLRQEMDKY